jgi:hypothetical protein
MRRKKELGLLHLKITLFFFWLLSSKEFFFVFLFFLGYPSLKSKTYFLPAEHYAFFFSFLFFASNFLILLQKWRSATREFSQNLVTRQIKKLKKS